MKITPESITSLEPNQIFVFGSNTEGRHGKGAALLARQKFGAIYGKAIGLQGQSYAIITKNLAKGERSFPLHSIRAQLIELFGHAEWDQSKEYLITKIGCSLAGYTVKEIVSCFKGLEIPSNVALPQEFWDIINKTE